MVTAANLLHANGIKVQLVLYLTKADLDNQLHPAIPVHYLNRKGRFSLAAMLQLKRLTAGADIVHIHSRHNLRFYMVARFLTGNFKPRIVYHEHTPQFEKIDRFTAFVLKKTDAYVAVVQSILAWARQSHVIAENKMYYLPNIVSDAAKTTGTFQEHTLMLAANFRRIKNHLFAIDLLKHLGPPFTLHMYGMVDDPEYYQEVLQHIAQSGVQDQVKIIHGVHKLSTVMPQYHFALHTAKSETGPLVLLEYMLAGVPFLTYNTGDVAVNLRVQIPELVVHSFNIAEWKEKIFSTMLNHQKRQELQVRMQQLIKQKFSSRQYVASLTNIYRSVLCNHTK